MKHLITATALALLSTTLFGQGVAIGTGNPTPHASAALDVQSFSQGMLVPRMSTAQRNAIPSPATGLLMFDTSTGSFWFRGASAWVELNGSGGSAAAAWNLTGNAGTDPNLNFVGTTDAQPLRFRVNGAPAGHLGGTSGSSQSTAMGIGALNGAPLGNYNSAFGYQAMTAATNGQFNVAIGHSALLSNTSGSLNTATGANALRTLASGTENTAVGANAMRDASGGIRNTAIGLGALRYNTNGQSNIAIGYQALDSTNSGNYNIAIGLNAMGRNLNGSSNVSVGSTSLSANTAGNYNAAIGTGALLVNTTGTLNASLGNGSLNANTTGSQNTAVGANSGPTATNRTNTTAVGYNATPSANNRITIGTSTNNNLTGGYGTWQNLSDGRFKQNVNADVPGLDFITRLRPVTYNLDAASVDRFLGIAQRMEASEDMEARQWYSSRLEEVSKEVLTGFIAQEVEAAAKEVGYAFDGVHHPVDEQDHYTIGYASFVVPLVKAVQEQQELIEELRNQLHTGATERADLLHRLEQLEGTSNHP